MDPEAPKKPYRKMIGCNFLILALVVIALLAGLVYWYSGGSEVAGPIIPPEP